MNSIRLGVFDIFGFIIPGIVYIILISLALNLVTPEQLINKILSLSLYSLLGYLFLSYLISFTLDTIAENCCLFLLKLIKGDFRKRVIANFNNDNPEAKIDDYHFLHIYAFADVYSPSSREKADIFAAWTVMVRNLFLGFLLFGILTIMYSFIHFSQVNWLIMLLKVLIAIIISTIFLFKTNSLFFLFHSHLLNTYHIISKNADKIESPKKSRAKKS